ncbi:segregation and condensation protein B [Granulicella aggregans]|uniref:Segregation and condensation protein B n=2 Tax=Granulicella aggregans TaxID=474949 RepID=A0A7W8E3V4_9BACT|nr:segregation and condensation protein B [Granulicella aggregans]
MSLKAKIEAVIYASEEPVTLAQLTGLLGQEAQAELDHLDSAQQSLALDGEPSADLEAEPTAAETSPLPEADIEGETAPEPAVEPESVPEKPTATEPEPEETAPSQEPEPTADSPVYEHPETEAPPAAEAQADAAAAPEAPKSASISKQDEKARERRLRDYFRSILDELIADYTTSARGLEIREVAGGYRLATKPEYHDAVRGFVKSLKPPLKLSLQALETLAVVAYKQPVTAPEISEIRGVDSGGVLGSLMARKLITTAGRKQVIGRPILYKTTRDFLLRFGLKDVSELPSIEEFEKMAGELADVEPVQEEIPMSSIEQSTNIPESPNDLEAEKSEVEPQSDGDSIPLDGSDESSAGVPAETAADEAIVDGRISGLPPQYDMPPDQDPGEEAPFDSPAMDAELQKEEAEEEAAEAQEAK